MKNADILLVGQTPPPYHGQAVVTEMLFDHDWEELKVERLRMSYSGSIDAVGKPGLRKFLHLLSLIWQTWILVLTKRPSILYYLPASANKVPVIRDIIYLCAVRWLFEKTVFHYHAGGLPEYLDSAGLLGKLAKRVYRAADLSVEICPTDCSPGEMFQAKKITFIPNGLDVRLVQKKASNKIFRVLFLGALNEGKGVLDVIKTAKYMQERDFEIEFILVGSWASSEFKKESLDLVSSEGVGSIVSFPGVKKGDDKWQAYADADVFLFPSHYKAENFPLVLIEAMAFGLPIISTKWRGIPQLVGESNSAILCDINAPEQYAEAIESLYTNIVTREKMGKNSSIQYRKNYTRERFVGRMKDAFTELLRYENDR